MYSLTFKSLILLFKICIHLIALKKKKKTNILTLHKQLIKYYERVWKSK